MDKPLVEVELQDDLGLALRETVFADDEPSLRGRIIRIWGNFLELRSGLLLRRLMADPPAAEVPAT